MWSCSLPALSITDTSTISGMAPRISATARSVLEGDWSGLMRDPSFSSCSSIVESEANTSRATQSAAVC